MTDLDTIRHEGIFSAVSFGDRLVDIVGCGANGSKVATGVAKLGVSNIRLWDGDRVEAHNIANQAYMLSDIGRLKVDALADHLRLASGVEAKTMPQFIEKPVAFGSVVFLCVDSMATRRKIWRQSICRKSRVKVMIETRIDIETYGVFTITPTNRDHIKLWEAESDYDDVPQSENPCGMPITIGATSSLAAAHSVWHFIRWWREAQGQETEQLLQPAITITLFPYHVEEHLLPEEE